MKRREFIAVLVGAVAGLPRTARAQKAPIRIGFLASGPAASLFVANKIDLIKQGLSDNGLIENRAMYLKRALRRETIKGFRSLHSIWPKPV
jgi:hypothetical protein